MGDFAMSRGMFWFASGFGVILFLMNFVVLFLFSDDDDGNSNLTAGAIVAVVIFAVFYLFLIYHAIKEPISPLAPISE